MGAWMRPWRWSWCGRCCGGRGWRGCGRRGWCRSSQLYGNETGDVQAGVGEERRITGRIEFLDRIVGGIGHVEIAAAVEGKTVRVVQAGVGKECRITGRIEFLDRIVVDVRDIEEHRLTLTLAARVVDSLDLR